MIVVDTSAVVDALAARPSDPDLLARLRDDGDLHALHLIDVEFLHAVRGLVAGGRLTVDRAADALTDLHDLRITRYPHVSLLERAWELRENATAYGAVFLALAEALEIPLVTTDAKLAAVPGARVQVELFETGATP